ncbi:L,D-transpeptidase [Sphingobium sp.]|uniref:L,D-transpeptidase n=1 Tax=Sphingobium sp. TaxID=1912891 RepID=UPI000DB0E75B|nr:L,D-transpeptidase [Sphingobium sp.]PZU63999.1 MAG: L,D-transpeptidase [Sphingobium sp.]
MDDTLFFPPASRKSSRRGILLRGLLLATAMSAQRSVWAQEASDPLSAERVRGLKPGQYLWFPEVSPTGPVLLIVSLLAQRAYVYRNGVPIGVSTVSTGKKGHETPTGVFTILQKHIDHKSNLYDDAPMPFMQRLTWDGVALHAGNLPGYPASHGCIRLPLPFARLLFDVTRLGMTVLISDRQSVPRIAPTPAFLKSDAATEQDAGSEEWKPQASPVGPMSILISTFDERIIVLRNGVEIGWAGVQIDGIVPSPTAYTLASIDAGGFHWVRLPLPGQPANAEEEISPDERARLRLPAGFQRNLRAALSPGVTAIITPDSLKRNSAGERLIVITTGEEK